MSSLKEVKGRIASVNSTLKITSAMKMVASAKLHRAQGAIENMLPYEHKLNTILSGFLASEGGTISSPFAEKREVERVAIVAVSSNSSLCGAFNANVVKKLNETLASYQALKRENILLFPIGKKIAEAVRKEGFAVQNNLYKLAEKPNYQEASQLAQTLMNLFLKKEIDRVELVYNHFKSTAVQVLTREEFLPIAPKVEAEKGFSTDYILEPDRETLIQTLIPQVLSLKIFTMLLDSSAAEHAARTIAMQMATDNATDLIQDLTIQYNKTRQQLITNELLDIMGSEVANS